MASIITLKAIGLNTNPNQLEVPEGSLVEARNVIIEKDNVIEPARGYRLYAEPFGLTTDRAYQIWEYKNRLIRQYGTTIEFQNGVLNSGVVNFDAFSGSFGPAKSGLRTKTVDSTGNLYFTSDTGIKKISAQDASQFSTSPGYITNAGGLKALDFTATLQITDGDQSSFLPQDSAVAYRIVWATLDANNVLVQGSPSQREEVYNPMTSLLIRDINSILLGLDRVSLSSTSLISDTDYVSSLNLANNSTSLEIQSAAIALANKIDIDILFANDSGTGAPLNIDSATSTTITSGVYTINFSAGTATDYFTVGDKIYLDGFSPTTGTLNGIQTVAAVTASSVSINTSATGPVTVSASATITSGKYRNLTQPGVPSVPTPNQELVEIQDYVQSILTNLQLEPDTATPPVIDGTARAAYLDPLNITKNASVKLNITIPEDATVKYFYQVYRSAIASATGTTSIDDIVPSDELQQVYEAYLTSSDISAGFVEVVDITPDQFRGANLYTNAATGEGILKSNDLPPFALDIARFKNVVFYANTRTRHHAQFSLLGVLDMIADYNNSIQPSISIITESSVNTYNFVTGLVEITDVVCNNASTLAASGTADYFLINSGENETEYYVWYKIGTATDPLISGKTGIEVIVDALDLASVVAQKTQNTILAYSYDFDCEIPTSGTVRISCTKQGYTTDSTDGTTGFTISTFQDGRGEDISNKEILLSSEISVATAVDETARSLVRVINGNNSEKVNAFYLSSANDVPGKFYLENKDLSNVPFYVIGNNSKTGASFNPDISNTFEITSITTGSNPVITTSSAHNVSNNELVIISLTNSTPSIDGVYTAKFINSTQFSIEVSSPVTVAGTSGVGYDYDSAIISENETKVNRIYYSKVDQPEAVPALDYLNVGASDKEILRIFPLRDSLFVFKEDGLYRISGETAPFTVQLFDSSVVLVAPDSVDVSNNVVYAFTTQGITTVTEGGSSNEITRPIEDELKQVRIIPNYQNTVFGIGYESDNSYTVFFPTSPDDENAKVGYRYSTKTLSWTTLERDVTCAFVNQVDDLLYVGCGDTNYIEQERKDLSRTDFAGREYSLTLSPNNYLGLNLRFNDVSNIYPGDVITQTQTLTCYEYNMLLKKLDFDPGVNDSDYYSTLVSSGGDNLRDKIIDLANKLDSDLGVSDTDYFSSIDTKSGSISSITLGSPTVITTSSPHGLKTGRFVSLTSTDSTPVVDGNYLVTVLSPTTFSIPIETTISGTTGNFSTVDSSFQDIKGCYNVIIDKLNNDSGVSFSNYNQLDNYTLQETIVISVNRPEKIVTVNLALDFVQGDMVLYKSIEHSVTYSPNLCGDPINYKHVREATLMFINKAFTSAELAFSTDLLPEFMKIPFNADGNGIFGHSNFGTGFFGGSSHSAPFRTYLPRQTQRCRYIVSRFTHNVARESFGLYGISLTFENTQSTRAYRG